MKAVRLHAYGDIDQFKLDEIPDPVPGEGEVLLKVAASGLNPVDLYTRQGFMQQFDPIDLPEVIGGDVAGTVVAVGAGVGGLSTGDRVITRLPKGRRAHAELAVAPAATSAKLPDNVGFEAGAALPLVAVTGRQAVDALGVKPGDRVLVAGALGAVGRVAVQYLKELGAVPVAGVRAERLAEGKAIAGEALDISVTPTTPSFDFAVSAAAPVAGNVVAFVRDGGKIASVVQTPDPGGRLEVLQIWGHDNPPVLQQVTDAVGRGALEIPVAKTFPLAGLGDAHTALADNPRGKVVLTH